MADERYEQHSGVPRSLVEFARLGWAVFRGQKSPEFFAVCFSRNRCRIFGIMPRTSGPDKALYVLYNRMVVVTMALHLMSLVGDLPEAAGNIFRFVDDINMLMGFCILIGKVWVFNWRGTEINRIVNKLDVLFRKLLTHRNREIRDLLRHYFLWEVASFMLFTVVESVFVMALLVQPIFGDQSIAFRAKLPFDGHNPDAHPFVWSALLIFQSLFTFFILYAAITVENVFCHMCSHVALHSQIICIRLKSLGVEQSIHEDPESMWRELRSIVRHHQLTIRLMDDINGVLYATYILQVFSSTVIFCMSGFASLLARNQYPVLIKQIFYIIMAMSQLFYWSFIGQLVYYKSMNVGIVAFQAHKWFAQSPGFQRNLMFLVQRSQKPLLVRAAPLNALHYDTFAAILRTSYSYFALLRTLVD